MYLDQNNKLITEAHTSYVQNKEFVVYWEGIPFVKGIPSGEDTIFHFLKEFSEKGFPESCNSLSGDFVCVVHHKLKKKYYAFIDNDGCSLLFYNDLALSTSLLTLIDNSNVSLQNLDPYCVIEFIQSGCIFGETPFFSNIQILGPDEILVFSDQAIEVRPKNLKEIAPIQAPEKTFLQIFNDIASSLQNRKISIDLTGGTDSRLLTLLFGKKNMNFETATLGRPGHPDVVIAEKVANALGLPNYTAFHEVKDEAKTLEELSELFVTFDGLFDIFRAHKFGYYHKKGRIGRGIDLGISGVAGELYKWPRWQKFWKEQRQSAIDRLVQDGFVNWYSNSRIPSDLFTDLYREIESTYSSWLINKLTKRFPEETGRDLLDTIFYQYSARGFCRVNTTGRVIKLYAPLMDRELVACARSIPVYERFFSAFHRKIMSSVNNEIASIEVTSKNYRTWLTKLNSPVWDITNLIVPKKVKHLFKRTAAKYKKIRYQPVNRASKFDTNLYKLIKQSGAGSDNIEVLKTLGILKSDVVIQAIDDTYFGRFFSLAELLKRVIN